MCIHMKYLIGKKIWQYKLTFYETITNSIWSVDRDAEVESMTEKEN